MTRSLDSIAAPLALALLGAATPASAAARGSTPATVPAQAQEAFFFDVQRLAQDAPTLFTQGPVAAFLNTMVEKGGPDLRAEGVTELAMASPGLAARDQPGLIVLGRQGGAAELGARLAAFLAEQGAGAVTPAAYHGQTFLRLEDGGGKARLVLADLPEGDALLSVHPAGTHALAEGAVDTLAGQNPSFAARHAPRWGTLLDTNVYADLVSTRGPLGETFLRRVGLAGFSSVEECRASFFADPEFAGMVGVYVSLATPDNQSAQELEVAVSARLEAALGALPPGNPLRPVLEEAQVMLDAAGVTVQSLIAQEVLLALLTGRLQS